MKNLLLGYVLGVFLTVTLFGALCISHQVSLHWTPEQRFIKIDHHVYRLAVQHVVR